LAGNPVSGLPANASRFEHRLKRDSVIDGSRVKPGDRVWGLPSTGLHTNGFSLARRVIAFIIDFIIISIPVVLVAMFIFAFGIVTLGLGFVNDLAQRVVSSLLHYVSCPIPPPSIGKAQEGP
jgi:hypothetical protein